MIQDGRLSELRGECSQRSQWRRRTEVKATILDFLSRQREQYFLGLRLKRGVRDTIRKAGVRG